ncbi:MAG: PhoU domain-containing protein [Haloarculaceae archaeon]
MYSRKVQKVGGGTFTVSLPQEWVREHGIDQGSILNIRQHSDTRLVIEPRAYGADSPYEVTVEADGGAATTERLLRAAYSAGADRLTLVGSSPLTDGQRRALETTATTLAGAATLSDSESGATVRILLDPEELSVRQLVRQLGFTALSMHREATTALTADDSTDVPGRDREADRLFATVDRSFQRSLMHLDEVDAIGTPRPELFDLWTTARALERVADCAERIAAIAVGNHFPARDPIEGVLHEDDFERVARLSREVVDTALGSVLEDADVAHEAFEIYDAVYADVRDLDRTLSRAPAADARHARVLDHIRRTAEHGTVIAECSLGASMRQMGAQTQTDDSDGPESLDRSEPRR